MLTKSGDSQRSFSLSINRQQPFSSPSIQVTIFPLNEKATVRRVYEDLPFVTSRLKGPQTWRSVFKTFEETQGAREANARRLEEKKKEKKKKKENKAGTPDEWRPREWFNILQIGLFSSFSPSKITSPALLRSRFAKRRLAAHMSGVSVFLLSGAHCASARTILCLHLAHTARSLAAALHRVTQITISTGCSRFGGQKGLHATPGAILTIKIWFRKCEILVWISTKRLARIQFRFTSLFKWSNRLTD